MRVAEQVAVLVNRATLNGQILAPERHKCGLKAGSAVNDHELGPRQAPGVQVGKEAAPGSRAFAAHVPDGEEHLLSVSPTWTRGASGGPSS